MIISDTKLWKYTNNFSWNHTELVLRMCLFMYITANVKKTKIYSHYSLIWFTFIFYFEPNQPVFEYVLYITKFSLFLALLDSWKLNWDRLQIVVEVFFSQFFFKYVQNFEENWHSRSLPCKWHLQFVAAHWYTGLRPLAGQGGGSIMLCWLKHWSKLEDAWMVRSSEKCLRGKFWVSLKIKYCCKPL